MLEDSTPDRERAHNLYGSEELSVLPYVGDLYGSVGPRIMLLLESQYAPSEADGGKASVSGRRLANWNVDLLSWHISRKESQKILTKVSRLLKSYLQVDIDERDVLRQTTFYNFIQFMIERGTQANDEQITASMFAFTKVLRIADPDIVISFGQGRVRSYLERYANLIGITLPQNCEFMPFRIGRATILNTSHPAAQFSYSSALNDLRTQIASTNTEAQWLPDGSVCPGCGREGRHVPRYPAAICRRCETVAVDKEGAFLDIQSAPLDRNFSFTVAGLACAASEAKFGGIVVQPVSAWVATGYQVESRSG